MSMTMEEKIDAARIPMLEEHIRLLEDEIWELKAEALRPASKAEIRWLKATNRTILRLGVLCQIVGACLVLWLVRQISPDNWMVIGAVGLAPGALFIYFSRLWCR